MATTKLDFTASEINEKLRYPIKAGKGIQTLIVSYNNESVENVLGNYNFSHGESHTTTENTTNTYIEGSSNYASGSHIHVEGRKCKVYKNNSHSEGYMTICRGNRAHSQNSLTEANGGGSHSEGFYTKAGSSYQHVQGKVNIEDVNQIYAHIVGNGTATINEAGYNIVVTEYNPRNIHTVDWNGNAWYAGSVTSNGADYAEFFEWLDGNTDNEDRIGLLVTLDGEKIKLANSGDEILGIISGTAAVLGDNYECEWNGKYLTDDFGRVIYDEIEEFINEEHITYEEIENKETGEKELVEHIEYEKVSIGFFKHPRINPNYDPEQTYINRANRPEWDTVGMIGKLYLRDDGTCQVNGYATVGENGIAVASSEKTNMRVLSRVNDNIIKVLLK